tara:strand:- start:489 stop:1010 length:522 start_codon:yes stop_codon:yes gene_type:complete
MSDPFIGQVIMFGGNFPPRGWAFCDGQLLAISSNDALFSILGTIYGGDGETTFALPDLRGSAVIHPGNGPGLSQRRLGAKGGAETETLNTNQIPAHTHTGKISVNTGNGGESNPSGQYIASHQAAFNEEPSSNSYLQGVTTENTGGNLPHNNIQPFQCAHYIIALFGTYPSRS